MEIINIEMLRKSTEKIRKKLKNENLCFIVGKKDIIEQFCEDKNIRLNYIMSGDEYAKILNVTEHIFYMISLIDKDIILNIKPVDLETINDDTIKHLLGLRLSNNKRVFYILDDNSEIDLLISLQNIICGYNK